MDSRPDWLIDLSHPSGAVERFVGGKAANLARLHRAGFTVAPGFCLGVDAYELFLRAGKLAGALNMELQRKPLEMLRWEELWDTALRIRAAFRACPVPAAIGEAVERALHDHHAPYGWAVRSSAPGEDSRSASFAGLHESVLPVFGAEDLLDAVRTVWASLWSDAALLYRQELGLDPRLSRMAVLVQPVVKGSPSGVAFGCDPLRADPRRVIIEAVPGRCGDLVDGWVEPGRWSLDKTTGEVRAEYGAGRHDAAVSLPLLRPVQLDAIRHAVIAVEAHMGWPADIEWTWRHGEMVLLQARPVTGLIAGEDDKRPWYLSLKPAPAKLRNLAERVAGSLIPELAAECDRLAAEPLVTCDDRTLGASIRERSASVERWKQTYHAEFIPLAHGVRQFGVYYNDLIQPDDPFEFVELLLGEQFLARQRDEALGRLAQHLAAHPALAHALREAAPLVPADWNDATRERLGRVPGGAVFVREFDVLCRTHLDVVFDGIRLAQDPGLVLHALVEASGTPRVRRDTSSRDELEHRFIAAAGPQRRDEAAEFLALARLSWRLRDDDNILIGRLESQLLRAAEAGAERLRGQGRFSGSASCGVELARRIAAALLDDVEAVIVAPENPPTDPGAPVPQQGRRQARQLTGQPAAPGLAGGAARLVRNREDLMAFRSGEVLVCDAIQPTMTHLVPLACAVVERRGGMLIHGAIIARELGIACVSGVERATEEIRAGQWVTVDGYLGIVTLGEAEFDLERVPAPGSP